MGETFTGRDFYSGGFFLGGREFSGFFLFRKEFHAGESVWERGEEGFLPANDTIN